MWVWVVGLGGVVRVQSVAWAAMVDCSCGWWWLELSCCHPLVPVSRAGSPSPLIPLPSRERVTEVVLSFMFGHGQVMVFQFLSGSVR